MLHMFKIFVSLVSGHASYNETECDFKQKNKSLCLIKFKLKEALKVSFNNDSYQVYWYELTIV